MTWRAISSTKRPLETFILLSLTHIEASNNIATFGFHGAQQFMNQVAVRRLERSVSAFSE
jgi:hypothetical protein